MTDRSLFEGHGRHHESSNEFSEEHGRRSLPEAVKCERKCNHKNCAEVAAAESLGNGVYKRHEKK